MRNALIRLAPCAVFVSALASAQVVEKPVSGGTNTGSAAAVPGTSANNPSGTLGGACVRSRIQPQNVRAHSSIRGSGCDRRR